MTTALTAVEIEALDVRGLGAFWAGALGRPLTADGPVATVRPPDRTGGIALRFVPSHRPKRAKNRLHLDLTGGPDQAAEVARLLGLGATAADIGQGDVPWQVLADPEGNEFCVLPRPEAPPGLGAICLDAADPLTQGGFWTTATGWPVTDSGDWGIRMRPPGDGDGPALVMGPPAAPKHGPNRLRFVLAGGEDPSADACALLAAGGARLGPGLLADPEGNEFLIVRQDGT